MRVLYVHHNSDLYGASRSLIRLIRNLDRTQFVPIVALAEDGPLRAELEQLNAEVVLCKNLSVITRPVFKSWRLLPFLLHFPRSVMDLVRLIRSRQIDLVHTNTGVITASALAAKLAGKPHVWHIRDWFGEFRWLWKPYARYIIWASTRIVAVSKAVATQFPNLEKVTVVNNGFCLDEFLVDKPNLARQFREQHALKDELVIGCVGRIKLIRKGQEVFVKAAKRLKDRGRAAKFVVVGAPYHGNEAHLDELKKLVSDLGLQSDIVFTGELSNPLPAYAAMDVFVLPSAQPEPFGGVVMEAMAMGIPVVATNIGGSVEQVADGETGFLVPPLDPAALADKLEVLITNEELRRQMGEAGPRRIQASFSLEAMAKNIESIYLNCFANSN